MTMEDLNTSAHELSHDTTRSVLDMPFANTKYAPKTFMGHFSEVQDFLDHYEQLCNRNNVIADADKCRIITRYCSRRVVQVIEGLDHFIIPNWSELKAAILRLYDANLNDKRYTKTDLKKFMLESREKKTKQWRDFTEYTRKFTTIGGWLKGHKKISEDEQATYYWKGIDAYTRTILEARLLMKDPKHDMSEPFKMQDVWEVAEAWLNADRFDRLEDDDNQGSFKFLRTADEDNKEDEEDEEAEKKPREAMRDRIRETQMPKLDYPSTSRTKIKETTQEEVENLIDQMSKLSLSDPKYGLLYYKAVKLDPLVAQTVRPPDVSRSSTSSVNSERSGNRSRENNSGTRPINRNCFGCGQNGHGIRNCPDIKELLSQGVIKYDHTGRLQMNDGSPISRNFDEPIIQAVKRQQPPAKKVNFITCEESEESYGMQDALYIHPEEELSGFPVTRSQKGITARHNGVMDVPRQKPTRSPRSRPPEKTSDEMPQTSLIKEISSPPIVQPMMKDVVMQDHQLIQKVDPRGNVPQSRDKSDSKGEKNSPAHRFPRQSEMSSNVNLHAVADRILAQDQLISTRELLRASPGLARIISDKLQYKSVKPNTETVMEVEGEESTSQAYWTKPFIPKTHGRLIRLTVSFSGHDVKAILDTGLQMNVCHARLAKLAQMPIDRTQRMNMNDANGGQGSLDGMLSGVRIDIGNIATTGNVYVGSQVPFDLLLGRPWQRGNLISIDERPDGTYLQFKDPDDPTRSKTRYELLVIPDGSNEVWDYDPATWLAVQPDIDDHDDYQKKFRQFIKDREQAIADVLEEEEGEVYTSFGSPLTSAECIVKEWEIEKQGTSIPVELMLIEQIPSESAEAHSKPDSKPDIHFERKRMHGSGETDSLDSMPELRDISETESEPDGPVDCYLGDDGNWKYDMTGGIGRAHSEIQLYEEVLKPKEKLGMLSTREAKAIQRIRSKYFESNTQNKARAKPAQRLITRYWQDDTEEGSKELGESSSKTRSQLEQEFIGEKFISTLHPIYEAPEMTNAKVSPFATPDKEIGSTKHPYQDDIIINADRLVVENLQGEQKRNRDSSDISGNRDNSMNCTPIGTVKPMKSDEFRLIYSENGGIREGQSEK
ncbi:hypothetical protein ACEPAG_2188 [Sanghuangporus baumii]